MQMPQLLSSRLSLRPFIWDDLDWLCELYSDPEVMRYLSDGRLRDRETTILSLSKVMQHWILHGFGMWAVCLRENGKRIGRCGVGYFHELDEAELSYTLAREAWGQGFATEAAQRVLQHAWEELHLPAVVAHARPGNLLSIRVMEKLGMRFVSKSECESAPAVGYRIENPLLARAGGAA
jgi:ribosomal-protein-alanine N-acetyltransferase